MRDDDLIAWAEGIDVSLPSGYFGSLAECNRILDVVERRSILEAAYLTVNGFHFEATLARERGGYDRRAREYDRIARGVRL